MSKSIAYSHHLRLDQSMPAVRPIPLKMQGLSKWQRIKKLLFFRRKWELTNNYVLSIPWLDILIIVPRGFTFDFASVPRFAWPILSPIGVLLLASVPHDFGYRYGGLIHIVMDANNIPVPKFKLWTKVELDTLLSDITEAVSCSKLIGEAARFGLKLGGFTYWDAARSENNDVYTDYEDLLIGRN